MSSDWWKTYRELCKQPLIIKRYTGTGINRPSFETAVMGDARQYSATDLIGAIQQGDHRVILLAEDLIDKQFPLPVVGNDKVIVEGVELAVLDVRQRKDLEGGLVAYELQCRG